MVPFDLVLILKRAVHARRQRRHIFCQPDIRLLFGWF